MLKKGILCALVLTAALAMSAFTVAPVEDGYKAKEIQTEGVYTILSASGNYAISLELPMQDLITQTEGDNIMITSKADTWIAFCMRAGDEELMLAAAKAGEMQEAIDGGKTIDEAIAAQLEELGVKAEILGYEEIDLPNANMAVEVRLLLSDEEETVNMVYTGLQTDKAFYMCGYMTIDELTFIQEMALKNLPATIDERG